MGVGAPELLVIGVIGLFWLTLWLPIIRGTLLGAVQGWRRWRGGRGRALMPGGSNLPADFDGSAPPRARAYEGGCGLQSILLSRGKSLIAGITADYLRQGDSRWG